jgi:hypothetical protein
LGATGLEIFPLSGSNTSRGARAQALSAAKLKWRASEKGNRFLSLYGLKATVFPNTRHGGWTVSIKQIMSYLPTQKILDGYC